MKKSLLLATVVMLAVSISASAGNIYLTGSDAPSFHGDSQFTNQLFTAMGGNILYLNNYGVTGNTTVAGQSVFGVSSLTGVTLSNYSGLYVASPGTCCSDPNADGGLNSTITANTSAINAFIAGGGSLGIGDFLGNGAGASAWAPILGFDPSAGILSNGGFDGDVSTAAGIAAGFTGNSNCGTNCYTDYQFAHQTYDSTFFAAHGYTSLITAGDGSGNSVFEASSVPEPGSIVLLGSGLLGLAGTIRRRMVR